jgi:SAM-dependent methyltransferase
VPEQSYDPRDYWSQRLSDEFTLRGVGHLSYSEAYNRWLYRHKARVLGRALAGVAPGARALDVGSGVGWVVEQLAGHGLQVDGSDIADVAVERLRQRFPGSRFFRVTVGTEPLPVPDATYDVVTLLDVAYHITDDALWRAAIDDIARVLRPGGRLIVTDFLGETTRQVACHVRLRGLPDWRSAAAAAGLTVDAVEPLHQWLSRDRDSSVLRPLPDRVRGGVEYVLESVLPREPLLRWARLTRPAPR